MTNVEVQSGHLRLYYDENKRAMVVVARKRGATTGLSDRSDGLLIVTALLS